jgi:murein L,D-transpeptidase YcbB/YkuD
MTTAACQERMAGAGSGFFGATSSQPQSNPALQSLVDGAGLQAIVSGPDMTPAERERLIDQVRRFYRGNNYQLIWIDGDRPSSRYRQLVHVLDAADDNGLPSALYNAPVEDADGKTRIPAERAPELDVRATARFFRYFLHLTGGRLDPHALESQWTLKPEKPELVAALTTAIGRNNLEQAVEELQPQSPQYTDLRKALARYRALAAKGGWPTIPADTRLRPGEQSPVVRTLRDRLSAEGDFTGLSENEQSEQSLVFDQALVEALKRFEERHRVKPDGLLDAETIAALNVSVAERIRAIDLALERWRWLPDPMPDRYLLVNVPDYRLDAMENGKSALSMRVVVGAPDKKTPIFADKMEYVIFSPYWNVPPDIARDETLPHVSKDPDYLARNNMEAVDASGQVIDPSSVDWSGNTKGIRIRQRPGSGNALGGVKFVFPNNFNVYLHDTNAGALFERMERSLSHGCVRVEEPQKLAQYVLRDQPAWTPEQIQAAMQAGQEKQVNLKMPIPVYILYMTAWVHDGGVRFLKDIYGHDANQEAQLWHESN